MVTNIFLAVILIVLVAVFRDVREARYLLTDLLETLSAIYSVIQSFRKDE